MSTELLQALEQLEKEKGIRKGYMLDKIAQALITAYRRDNAGISENIFVEPDEEKKEIRMYVKKTVTETPSNPALEIGLEDAKKISKKEPMIRPVVK
jgi:N utilization substance protein A